MSRCTHMGGRASRSSNGSPPAHLEEGAGKQSGHLAAPSELSGKWSRYAVARDGGSVGGEPRYSLAPSQPAVARRRLRPTIQRAATGRPPPFGGDGSGRARTKGHEPSPAFALDARWNMVVANDMVAPF